MYQNTKDFTDFDCMMGVGWGSFQILRCLSPDPAQIRYLSLNLVQIRYLSLLARRRRKIFAILESRNTIFFKEITI